MVDGYRSFRLASLRSGWTCVSGDLLFSWFLLLFLGSTSSVGFGQGAKPFSEPQPRHVADKVRATQREQWFLRGRAIPGESAATLRYRALLQKTRMRPARLAQAQKAGQSASCQNSPLGVWCPLGPAPLASDASGDGQYDYSWVSGRATAVAVDPADQTGNTVYVGGAYGGVWKSQNTACGSFGNASCVTWTPITDSQATLAVGAIAIQPGNTGVIVVGTGEANSSADSYYGLGILRSTNAGNSWILISSDSTGTRSFAGMAFSKIAFSTSNPNLVVAAAAGASEGIIEGLEDPVTANLGLYYSINGGASWTYANVSDGGVAVAPGSVSSVIYNGSAGMFFAALRYHGFYSSSDGINWTRLANQPGTGLTTSACPPNPSSSSCPIYRGEIAVVPGRNEMYAWYVDANDFDQGIWTTANSGNTPWSQINDAGIINCGDEIGCGTEQGGYNLELAAVPNGSSGVTDLYAGAINLYKCEITSTYPTCSGSGSNTFLNLTHVYGCSSIAKVHPAQHDIASLINTNAQDVMYFANDGGIYRALDGYTGLTTGTCSGSNQFDSLNQTLGSMTQFVSFSQASSDPDVILGGTQGNGSPGTASALISSSWLNVNFGDGGYNQIDPTNEDAWFVSNPPDAISGVNIFACASGINCHTQDFQNNQIVSSATVGGDTGPYYPPFIFQPGDPTQLIVGTCRVWRGPSVGGTYSVLSHSFETGGDGICTGNEMNLVRSLAAAVDLNSFTAIYAGTDSFGPLIPTSPPGGRVWVSPNVANGPSSWVDQTGTINPNNFPISGIAIDSSDRSAQSAYVSIMGWNTVAFPTSHLWQTTNGGITWADFSGSPPNALPDAPANAVLVDSGIVYVGTDVGVFASSTASPSWTEVGTTGGYLPNVAVTALAMYNDGRDQLLRASTYGRGVWQFPIVTTPYYVLTVTPNTMTVFGSQPAVFSGEAIALNGYQGSVTLSCGGTSPPSTWSFSPNPVTLSAQNSVADFTLTASGADRDYSFAVDGIDVNQLEYEFPLTLHVVDFALTQLSTSSISVNIPNTSGPVQFQVTAAGSFNAAVDLSCIGLPAEAACNFEPSSSVNPTAGKPVKVILTIGTMPGTPTGTFPITINGATAGGPNRQPPPPPLSLTITNFADYGLAATCSKSAQCSCTDSATAIASVTGLCVFNGTLTAQNGYNSVVNLSCGSGAPPTCVANPTQLTPTGTGAPFTVTVKSKVDQVYGFNIAGKGTDPSGIGHTVPVKFTTTFDFQITNESGVQSIPAGQAAIYDLDVMPLGGNFPNSVALSCFGLPLESACSFSPAQVNAGSGDTKVELTISTTAPVLSSLRPVGARRSDLYRLGLLLPGLLLSRWPRRRQPRRNRNQILATLAVGAVLLGLLIACGGGSGSSSTSGNSGQPGTNPGTYTVMVKAVSGTLARTTPVTLTVN